MMTTDSRLSWMDEEASRADENVQNKTTENPDAPVLVKRTRRKTAPARKTHGAYVQTEIWNRFEVVAMEQKQKGNANQPELLEEALEYIIQKYSS